MILFPYSGAGVGGSVVSGSRIAQFMREHGLACTAVFPREGAGSETFRRVGVPVEFTDLDERFVGRLTDLTTRAQKLHALTAVWREFWKACTYLRRHRVALVHVNGGKTMFTWGLAAKGLGIPVLWHVRQEVGDPWLDRLRLRIADRVILIADSTRKRFGGRMPSRGTRIYNAVDTDVFIPSKDRAKAKRALGFSPEKAVVGFVGNFGASKRPEWAVQAGIGLLAQGRSAEIVLVGTEHRGDEYTQRLNRMVDEAGFCGSFHFLGRRLDIPDLMKAFDIFLLPSRSEAFGLVVIEAMASGVPVLATRAGGVPEIIDDGKTGRLVPSDDYASFQEGLIDLVDDTQARSAMGVEARRAAVERFSVDRMGREILGVYEEVLGDGLSNLILGDKARES